MSFNFSSNYGFLVQNATYDRAPVDAGMPGQLLTTTHTSANLRVTMYPRWLKQITLEWSVPADWGNCLFNVYFSQVENTGFEKLNKTPLTGTFLADTLTREQRRFNTGFYVVEAQLLDQGNALIRSPVITWENNQRNWVALRSREIQRREYFLLSHFVGVKSYLFRRKTYGERCPECWDYRQEKMIKDHCKTCMGTSFKGGYFDAFPCFVNYDTTGNQNLKTYFGVFEPNQMGAWTISLPEIRPDDVLIRYGDWAAYRIAGITPTELQTVTVRQILKLTQLSRTDIENELVSRGLPEFPEEYA